MQDILYAIGIHDLGDVLVWLSILIGLIVFIQVALTLAKPRKDQGPVSRGFLLFIGILLLLATFPVWLVLSFALNYKSDNPSIIPELLGLGMVVGGVFIISAARREK